MLFLFVLLLCPFVCFNRDRHVKILSYYVSFSRHTYFRGGSRGRMQVLRTPPPPPNDLRFSNTTGIVPKKKKTWFTGVEVEQ